MKELLEFILTDFRTFIGTIVLTGIWTFYFTVGIGAIHRVNQRFKEEREDRRNGI